MSLLQAHLQYEKERLETLNKDLRNDWIAKHLRQAIRKEITRLERRLKHEKRTVQSSLCESAPGAISDTKTFIDKHWPIVWRYYNAISRVFIRSSSQGKVGAK